MTSDFKLRCLLGPITSLSICGIKIIIGCGSEITVYNLHSGKYETKVQVFSGSSVHGLKKGPTRENKTLLCVFGSKQACVVTVTNCSQSDSESEFTDVSEVVTVKDWIWDAKWLKDEGSASGNTGPWPRSVALALAHNSVLCWDWAGNTVQHESHCVEKCILYCAHLIGNVWFDLVLAAGTVFNKVVMWPVACGPGDKSDPVELIHTLAGHDGVIFSMSFNTSKLILCSASDDRSIRLWQFNFPNREAKDSNELKASDWRGVESHLLMCLYGHGARVWKVMLMDRGLASVGEDATCLVWDYEGKIINKFKGHQGKSIWSMAIAEDEKSLVTGGGDGSVRLWTLDDREGHTKDIVLLEAWQLCGLDDFARSVTLLRRDTVLVMMNSGALLAYNVSTGAFNEWMKDSEFRSYSVLSPGPDECTVAVGSIGGRLCVVREGRHQIIELFQGKVMSVAWVDGGTLVVSGPGGRCVLLTLQPSNDLDPCDPCDPCDPLVIEKKCELTLPLSKHCWVTAACVWHGPREVEANHGVGANGGGQVDGGGQEDANGDHSSLSLSTKALLVCGDKDGSLHTFVLTDHDTDQPVQASQTMHRVHSKAGVTFLCSRSGLVHSAGRDGFYRQWGGSQRGLAQLNGTKIVKGFEWIDSLQWRGDDLLVFGFFSSRFCVWSTELTQALHSVECGGGHRSWGCQYNPGAQAQDQSTLVGQSSPGSLRFVYLKAGEVHLVDSAQVARQQIVQSPLHGRELNDAKILGFLDQTNGPPAPLVVTVSDDNSINLGLFTSDESIMHWKPLVSLRGHLSSVRCVGVAPCDDSVCVSPSREFLLFSGGGRAELRAWKVKVNSPFSGQDRWERPWSQTHVDESGKPASGSKQHEDCDRHVNDNDSLYSEQDNKSEDSGDFNSRCPCSYQHLTTHFLGESRHKRKNRTWKTKSLTLDPETRVMGVAATPLSQLISSKEGDHGDHASQKDLARNDILGLYLLSLAGSDGLLRVLLFSSSTNTFTDVCQTSHHKGCVLKVHHHLQHTSSDTPGGPPTLIMMSASTNGQIVFWSLNEKVHEVVERTKSKIAKCEDVENCDDSIAPAIEKETPDPWQPLTSIHAHQSGVNSLHSLQISASQLLVASGGDDNALTVLMCNVKGSKVVCEAKVTQPCAHGAQVTGVHLVSPSCVVSTSIDQRLCVWRLETADHTLKMELISSKYSNLADPSCMDVKTFRQSVYTLCGGEGLSLHSFNDSSTQDQDQCVQSNTYT